MACPVCYGASDPVVRESMNAGILVLLGVTAVVLGGFARFIASIARRSRTEPVPLTVRRQADTASPAAWEQRA